MEIKKAMANALKEMVVPELTKIREDVNNVKGVLELTNKRLDDINLHLADQSRRIDETNKRIDETNKKIDSTREELGQRIDETNRRIDETNDRLNRLYEVIVRRDEHTTLDQKVLALEKDVQELKLKIAV
jgi:predicted  nucleic acid-binding Zn-ribbon protein